MTFTPPVPPYDPTDKSGFSYETVLKRWPIILTSVIDRVNRDSNNLHAKLGSDPAGDTIIQARIAEGKKIIEHISKLKYEMARDREMPEIPDDGEPSVAIFNAELDALRRDGGRNTWFKAPWLFAECYLYRLLRSYFVQTEHWSAYDPFFAQKLDTFRGSAAVVLRASAMYFLLASTLQEIGNEKDLLSNGAEKLKILFEEMIQMCLWGNATDLSLLTHLTSEDMADLQAVGRDAQERRKTFILRDDKDSVWECIRGMKDGRIDFVLDNSGFELITDLVFSDFLVTYTPYVSKVVFHPKLIPWFVSDVTPPDFNATVDALCHVDFLKSNALAASDTKGHLASMVARWRAYLADGTFALSVPRSTPLGGGKGQGTNAEFWTTPYPYWDMETRANALWGDLRQSGLVIFKGDLNYRKLTGDVKWPAWTSFEEALGPLAGSFPLVSLRTNKADVVVGVNKETAERLDIEDKKWRVDGRYASSFI
ncbi:DUF89 domain-containing protein [Fistulina hepatica ATCC 64428]|uniref:Sugar phosphate phosphatase n=1 Tax=Fistulina hepatica ATCC 64428 TaxID=1128425 RepID=A0A0D7A7W9_9AGAR|nr:DUF89 domain-containing protein [Fistulina hepatica ATCC 64428]